MTRTITAALIAVGLLAVALVPAQAQTSTSGTVVVPAPAPSASPGTTVVQPSASGTTIVAPPGSTVTVTPPPATRPIALQSWCAGAYSPMGGSNFGSCPGNVPR
jgi:hypothetical protein